MPSVSIATYVTISTNVASWLATRHVTIVYGLGMLWGSAAKHQPLPQLEQLYVDRCISHGLKPHPTCY